jgi:hypothetical protein
LYVKPDPQGHGGDIFFPKPPPDLVLIVFPFFPVHNADDDVDADKLDGIIMPCDGNNPLIKV